MPSERQRYMTPEGYERFADLLRFGYHLVGSSDVDPLYPVLKYLQAEETVEEALWMSFIYVAWYNLPVAFQYWDDNRRFPGHAEFLSDIEHSWPTGIERRANRGGKVVDHIHSYIGAVVEAGGNQFNWYTTGFSSRENRRNRIDNWRILNTRLQTVFLNGRWAAYKHCEVLRRVNDLNVLAPDMGMRNSSGPRDGLALFFPTVEGQSDGAIRTLDEQATMLTDWYNKRSPWPVDIEEMETILCNYHSLHKGKYYVGHDIDELQEQITVAQERGILRPDQARRLYDARRNSLPHHYLGELNGWYGVDKRRMKAYAERSQIVGRKP